MLSYHVITGFNRKGGNAAEKVWKLNYPEVFSNVGILTKASPEMEKIAFYIMNKLLPHEKLF